MPVLSDDEIIEALYRGLLDREPDQGGRENYRNRIREGTNLTELISEFVQSEEFRKRNGDSFLRPDNYHSAVGLRDDRLAGWNQADKAELIEGVKIGADDVVADIGCGKGGRLSFCARFAKKVIGIDIDPACIEITAEKLKNIGVAQYETHVIDGTSLPLPSKSVDIVICTEVLEHVDDPAKVLSEMRRIGKPGTVYVISVPDPIHEYARKKTAPASSFKKPNHVRIIERIEFENMVENAGLQVKKHLFFGFYQSFRTIVQWKCPLDSNGRNPVLDHWAKTWESLIGSPNGKICKDALDQAMPKSQVIIAQRPAE